MMVLSTLAGKLSQYAAELRFCAALGDRMGSRLMLGLETMRFHLANGSRRQPRAQAPRRFAVRLAGQQSELWLRPLSGDLFVLHEVFVGECYRIPEAWRGTGRCVVDLGANIGLTTLFLQRYFPQASFVCVEPEPSNAELLRRNTAWLGGRVQVVEAAVSDQPGEAIFDDSQPTWGGQLREGAGPGRSVRCVTMDEILALTPEGRIDVLKIDIEGAEARLFRGPCHWLRQVQTLVIELHGAYGHQQFEADMMRLGFQVLYPDPQLGNQQIFALNKQPVQTTVHSSLAQAAR